MNDEKELAALIDELMQSGSGHININGSDGVTTVSTVSSTVCNGNSPCRAPNFEDLDEELF